MYSLSRIIFSKHSCLVFCAIAIHLGIRPCVWQESNTWELSSIDQKIFPDDLPLEKLVFEGHGSFERVESAYLVYSDELKPSCSIPPHDPIPETTISSILVTKYNSDCDLAFKVEQAEGMGYRGVIFIRSSGYGYMPDYQETKLRNRNLNFNILFTHADNGHLIRKFRVKSFSEPSRFKVKIIPAPLTWSDVSICIRENYESTRNFVLKNMDIIIGSGILLATTFFIGFSFLTVIYYELYRIWKMLHKEKFQEVEPEPVFEPLAELTWNETDQNLPSFCAICLDIFSTGQQLIRLPCGHCEFHNACIFEWLKSIEHRHCPICRHDVPDKHLDPKIFPCRLPPLQESLRFMAQMERMRYEVQRDWNQAAVMEVYRLGFGLNRP
jgi:hypothetical protein